MKKCLLLLVSFMLIAGTVYAAPKDKGTEKEAVTMVKKAVALVKEKGRINAFKEFNNPKGKFVRKDLYIFVFDMNGKCLAHGVNPSLIGKNFIMLKDSQGVPFVKEIVDVSKAKGGGKVNYKWTHPESKKIENKSTYFETVDNVIISCGYYR